MNMLYCVELLPRVADLPPVVSERLWADAAAFFDTAPRNFERHALYLLEFEESAEPEKVRQAAQRAAESLLSDSVTQTYRGGPVEEYFSELGRENAAALIVAAYRPGVTDAEGESTRQGYAVLSEAGDEQNLPALVRVRTATLYRLDFEILPPAPTLNRFARRFLINELVQDCITLLPKEGDERLAAFAQAQFNFGSKATGTVRTVALREAGNEELAQISKEGLLALNPEEMAAIQTYYQNEDRDPTDIELETLAQTWSEHCVHKTFKALIDYSEQNAEGETTTRLEIDGLFKTYIADPTYKLNKPWIVSAFVDNAGVIRLDPAWDVSFKVETHNHPSALEPFGGANTGLGGVIRDVMAVSAKPIAATDVFCFGDPATLPESIPADVLPPARVFQGVVDGVRDYGNKMGLPTVNGAILFDRGFLANPLVFCGTVGLAPHGSHPRNQAVGDRIVVIGGRTGRDGIHGATFSSIELGGDALETETAEATGGKAASVVQIGNPIEEKKTLDLLLKARDRRLYNAITDCGAGGLSSAVGEMGADLGVRMELSRVPLKYAGLDPWEIWVSEAQERMVLAISPDKLPEFMELCQVEGVEATDLGEFTGDGLLSLFYNDQPVGQLKMQFLHNGLPRRHLTATWQDRAPRPIKRRAHYEHHRPYQGYNVVLQRILADPNIASKEAVIRVYDHEVQGGTVIKPLVGPGHDGPGDAAIIQPLPGSTKGLVISNGINPRYSLLDPYHMAACAIDEAVRNAIAVGANLDRMALLDNFCWGNPNDPARLGELVRAALACRDFALAFGLPYISGKDSLNNEFRDPTTGERTAIPGTLLISALGVIDDFTKAVTMDLKAEGNLLYIAGRTRPELGASYYAKYHGQVEGEVPKVEAGSALRTFRAVTKAIRQGLVRSCHDLSEGGLAVAAAEMAFAGGLGLRYDLTRVPYIGPKSDRTNATLLFSETPSRFLLEVEPARRAEFEAAMAGSVVALVGTVLADDEYTVRGLTTATVLRVRSSELKRAWQTPLI